MLSTRSRPRHFAVTGDAGLVAKTGAAEDVPGGDPPGSDADESAPGVVVEGGNPPDGLAAPTSGGADPGQGPCPHPVQAQSESFTSVLQRLQGGSRDPGTALRDVLLS